MFVSSAIAIDGVKTADAQGVKKAADAGMKGGMSEKKGGGKANGAEADHEMPILDFGIKSEVQDHSVVDPDETYEGKARLNVVMDRAKEINRAVDEVQKERIPKVARRNQLGTEIGQRSDEIVQLDAGIQKAKIDLNTVQLSNLTNAQKNQASQTITAGAAQLNKRIGILQEEIALRKPNFDSLDAQVGILNQKLWKLIEELNACREQWLEIRVPVEKYARAEYENLRQVIDDWSRIDGLWPQAYCWAAMCAFELGDYETAWKLVEKGDKIRIEVYNSRKGWRQLMALKGLIAHNIPRLNAKSDGWLTDALSGIDRKSDWQTFLIVGRAYAQKPRFAKKAEVQLNVALKIKPDCMSAQYQLALLQTSANSGVTDVTAGTKLLEDLWTKTGKRSWRIGYALAKAYTAAEREDDAETLSAVILDLAPSKERLRLRNERNKE